MVHEASITTEYKNQLILLNTAAGEFLVFLLQHEPKLLLYCMRVIVNIAKLSTNKTKH